LRWVVDTNVPIAANGINTHASLLCQKACIEFLEMLVYTSESHIAIDTLGQIIKEYSNHLKHRGQPGVGDLFFKHIHDNMHSKNKIIIIAITPTNDSKKGFEELPINQIDPSDRKFLAVAKESASTIANALDTDWHIEQEFIQSIGVEVQQLCPEHGCNI